MKMIKATLAAITGAVCICNAVCSSLCMLNASAKVIEPEIVHTETWTTSYFIDDDMETLYPYIDCQADIYNDGTMTVYFWNNHEWDGFATVNHNVTIISTQPSHYSNQSGAEIRKSAFGDGVLEYDISKFDKSYFPNDYEFNTRISPWLGQDTDSYFERKTSAYSYIIDNCSHGFTYFSFYGALPNLKVDSKLSFTLTPVVEPVGTYEFHILGHDITITPEILSGSSIAQPQLTEQEQKIKQLEEENAALKAENTRLNSMIDVDSVMRFDTDGNGILDAKDASTILMIYAINSTGGNIKTLTELKEYNSQNAK